MRDPVADEIFQNMLACKVQFSYYKGEQDMLNSM